ncbi:MAG TPA: hypothetical protein VE621_00110 [Bryobacteraceae bacterium]|nr:hypothetical protein [Bryobacteraceae bacterium]
MLTRRKALVASFTLPVLLTSCTSSEPPKKAETPKAPPEPVTGRTAFFRMYSPARIWSPDIQVLRLNSLNLEQLRGEKGKYPAWEATFVSPSKRQARSFTYSVIEAGGNLHEGVFASREEPFSGSSGQATPWAVQAFKIDSDKAYEVALGKSADYVAKNPNKPMFFLLELTPRHPNVAWRVVWGESVGTSDYSIYVDATTGEFLERTK